MTTTPPFRARSPSVSSTAVAKDILLGERLGIAVDSNLDRQGL